MSTFLFTGCKKDDTGSKEKAPEIVWEKTYGGSDVDYLYAMKKTADDGYILYGHTLSTDGDVTKRFDLNDLWLVKVNAQGDIEWQNTYGGNGTDVSTNLELSADGGYLIVGTTNSVDGDFSTSCVDPGGFVMKLDSGGNVQWVYKACRNINDAVVSVAEKSEGSVFVVGYEVTTTFNGSVPVDNYDRYIAKFSASGTMQWKNYIGGTNQVAISNIKILSDGNIIVTGSSKSPDIPGNTGDDINNIYLAKLSSADGSVLWQKCVDYGSGVVAKEDKDGNIVIVGLNYKASDNHGAMDFYVVKTDANGNVLNKKSFGGSANDFAGDLFITKDNDYLISGQVRSNDQDVSGNHGEMDIWLIKLDSDLNMKWQKCLGSPALDAGYSVDVNTDGKIAVAGYVGSDGGDVNNYHGGMLDYWLAVLK